MYNERSTSKSGNNILKRIILFFVVVQFIICTTAQAELINITGAEQQVGVGVGYNDSAGVDQDDPPQYDPSEPQGPSDADLNTSIANYGVSVSASLVSQFSEDQIAADGLASGLAEWGAQPSGATDIHGGAVSLFSLSFTKDSSPTYFYVNGEIVISIEGDPGRNPDEVFAYMRLSSDDGGGMTPIWEESADGGSGNISVPVTHGLWLDAGKTYLFEAYEEAGMGIISEYSTASQSNSASFSFTATVTEGEPAHIDIVQDTISNKTKSITCNIWPPSGYDVTQIDQDNIRLNDEILPDRISVREHQQMLVVKFPTSELLLEPGLLVLTVSGALTDETTFEDSDTVTVVQKGGKTSGLDIDWIVITSMKQFRDGIAQGDYPWLLDFVVRVVDAGILHHIDVTKPGGVSPFVTLYENAGSDYWGVESPPDYTSLSELRDACPEGDYKFDFRDSHGRLIKSLDIAYSNLPEEPTAPVNFTYPDTNGQTGISINPTFTWNVSSDAGDALMTMVFDGSSDADNLVYIEPLMSISSTSWTPGPLSAGQEYDLAVSVANIKDLEDGPAFPTMTDTTGDTFSYTLMIEYLNEIAFSTAD